MIKQIYEQGIAQIEGDRQRKIEAERQRVIREQVVPFNAEIDTALRDAIAEENRQCNATIAAVQARFEEQRKSLTEAAERKKKENAEAVIATAVAVINKKADDAIRYLKDYLEKQGE